MNAASVPSPTSPTFRAELARLVSPLRRVRPRVPFWQLAAHRIPTLALYRELLRNAPTENIRFRVSMLFRQNHHLTGTEGTIKYLNMGYKWLDIFQKSKQGNAHYAKVLARYSSLIAAKREKAYWMYLGHKEMAWQFKLRSRPILTALFRASTKNPPLPRLKPQPLALSMIIKKRRAAEVTRHSMFLKLQAMKELIRSEHAFEKGVIDNTQHHGQCATEAAFAGIREWMQPINATMSELWSASNRSRQRVQQPVPEWLKQAVRKARTERIANKTRELERERRGEILPRTIRRRQKEPPAHNLSKMTEEQKKLDKVVRSVSEVGYVAMVKKRLGLKMRDPDAWKKEIGPTTGEEGRRLRKIADEFYVETERRRSAAECDQRI